MKILFITSTRLGDAVLSTGALAHFLRTYPDADVTVACGPLVAGLFAPVARVIPLKKEPYAGHWRKLWLRTVGTRWDIIVDLRNSLVSRLLWGKKKYIWHKPNPAKHKVEQIADVIGVSPPPAPLLWFDDDARGKAEALIPPGAPVLAVGPAANWPAKTWPAENFVELIQKLGFPRVAVIAAPGEEETARKVLDAIPGAIDVIAKTSPLEAAAVIQRCALYVGNDSGLMHCAAAAGVPTLGLFGPSHIVQYRPWGARCATAATPESYAQLTSYPGYNPRTAPCLMGSLTVAAAHEAAMTLLKPIY